MLCACDDAEDFRINNNNNNQFLCVAASVRRSSKRDISSLRRAVSVHVKIDAQRRILFDLFHSICCSSESFGINCFIESQTKSKCV